MGQPRLQDCHFSTCLELGRGDTGLYCIGDSCLLHTRVFEDIGLVWNNKRRRAGGAGGSAPAQGTAATALGGWLEDEDEFGVDEEELRQLEALGLPAGFGTSKARSTPFDFRAESFHASIPAAAAKPRIEDEVASLPAAATGESSKQQVDTAARSLPMPEQPQQHPPDSSGHANSASQPPAAGESAEQQAWAAAAAAQGAVSLASSWQQAWDAGTGLFYYYNEGLQQTQWEPPAEGFRPAPYEWVAAATYAYQQAQQAAPHRAHGQAHPHQHHHDHHGDSQHQHHNAHQGQQQQQQHGWARVVSAADLEQQLLTRAASEKLLAQQAQQAAQQDRHAVLKAAVSVADLEAQLLAAAGSSNGAATAENSGQGHQRAQEQEQAALHAEAQQQQRDGEGCSDALAASPSGEQVLPEPAVCEPPLVSVERWQQQHQQDEQQHQMAAEHASGSLDGGSGSGPLLLEGVAPPQGSHIRFDSDDEDGRGEEGLGCPADTAPVLSRPAMQAEQDTCTAVTLPEALPAREAAASPSMEQLAAGMQGLMAAESPGGPSSAQAAAGAPAGAEAEEAGNLEAAGAEAQTAGAGADADGDDQQQQSAKKCKKKKKKKGPAQEQGSSHGQGNQRQAGAATSAPASDAHGGARGIGGGRRPLRLPGEMDRKLEKYWLQRYSLFSRFDEGIQVDDQGWYSVTPEVIAAHHAQRAVEALGPDCVACDPFAGAGGNVIQFALACRRVVAVEIDEGRMGMLQNNARVYGVHGKCDFIRGDFFEHAHAIQADVVFYSPPWGGPEYANQAVYDVQLMGGQGFGLKKLLDLAFGPMGARGAIAFLPRNCDLSQLAGTLPEGHTYCEVEREMVNNVCKGLTIYYGELARRPDRLLAEAQAAAAVQAVPQAQQQPEEPPVQGEEHEVQGQATTTHACQEQEQHADADPPEASKQAGQAAEEAGGDGEALSAAGDGRKGVCCQQ